jgi:RNA polymerase sigma-70 factor (ECF subfamily)
MTRQELFDELAARLRAGDPEAAQLLFQRYAGRLIGLARKHLDTVIRQKVDPEEVVQSAFKSFFPRLAGGKFELENWEGLWSLLVTITLRKCGKKVARFFGPSRDVRKEIPLPAGADEGPVNWQAVSGEPTPHEAATLAELVEVLMHGLGDRGRQVVELRLQGYTVPEISAQVGWTEHTVEGQLRRLRKRLRRQLDSER